MSLPRPAAGTTTYGVTIYSADGQTVFERRYRTATMRTALDLALNELRTHDAGHGKLAHTMHVQALDSSD